MTTTATATGLKEHHYFMIWVIAIVAVIIILFIWHNKMQAANAAQQNNGNVISDISNVVSPFTTSPNTPYEGIATSNTNPSYIMIPPDQTTGNNNFEAGTQAMSN
jgi:hypothetical protein